MVASAERRVDATSVPPQRILVAEDNHTTQDLLRLLLTQRGHRVDVVDDGEMALDALVKRSYDVVLLDFHLPKMNGLQVAAAYRAGRQRDEGPRFVAITSDMKGLLGHLSNCENFDSFVPKPFDLEDICNVIEGTVQDTAVTDEDEAKASRTGASPIQELGYDLLRWPDDFNADNTSARVLQASLGDARFDAVLIREHATANDLKLLWANKSLHVLPVIDVTGNLGPRADIDASKLNVGETDQLNSVIEDFHRRRATLHKDLLHADNFSDKLLARIYVSGGRLSASYEPNSPGFFCYNTLPEYDAVEREAYKLYKAGFLTPHFFDRLHICDRCASSRFNVREECSKCRSSNLAEETYLHHFKCSYQGPEADFRHGDSLMCPKCRQELAHFSVDYDKPGSMLACGDCGTATSEPDVGFVCMDCGAHAKGDSVGTHDVHSYSLSERGNAYAETGKALLENKSRALRLAELPLELIVSLNGELKHYESDGTPFTLLDITYSNANEIAHEHGTRMFHQSRVQFLENLRQVLPADNLVVQGHSYDVALMKRIDVAAAQSLIDEIISEATEILRHDLGVKIHTYGAEDFA